MKILLATGNRAKIMEIGSLFRELGIDFLSFSDLSGDPPEVVEDGSTFSENAAKKALSAVRWSGMPALADDSGLVVPALGGEPGVRSARYAGDEGNMEANMDLLLRKMAQIPERDRLAYFVCVLVLAAPDGRTWEASGRVDGLITFQRQGKGGFGYDPVFFYLPADRTFAEIGLEAKNKVSHRSRALRDFAKRWPEIEKELRDGDQATGRLNDWRTRQPGG